MTNKERIDFIREKWGEVALDNITNGIITDNANTSMTMDEFFTHCTACGGNWGGMLLTGIKELWPHVWDAIPDEMGVYAWACLCDTIALCGVQMEE